MRTLSNRALPFAVGVAVLALAGCGSAGTVRSSGGMMSPNASVGQRAGGGMMGYQYSRLSCTPAANLPGRTVTVTLADMGMNQMMGGDAPLGVHMMLRAPDVVPAGKLTLVAENLGWRTHELVILPLAAGSVAGHRIPGPDGKVDEAGSLGEASASCAGAAGEGIRAGTVGWVTVTLPAGRYELACNLPNHYADGMYQEFTVSTS